MILLSILYVAAAHFVDISEVLQFSVHVNCIKAILITDFGNDINTDVTVTAEKTCRCEKGQLLDESDILLRKSALQLLHDHINNCYECVNFHSFLAVQALNLNRLLPVRRAFSSSSCSVLSEIHAKPDVWWQNQHRFPTMSFCICS